MRRLKIFMDQKNYMCIGNTHLFFNFNHANLEYITSINPRSVQTIHIFLTTHAAVNHDLKILIDKYKKFVVDGQEYRSKIVIHLPRRIKELKTLIEKFLGPDYVIDNGYTLITERKGPRFMLDAYPDCNQYIDNWLNIIYDKSSIKITMTREPGHPEKHVLYGIGAYPMSVKFPEYPYNVIDKENDPGIFETAEMRLDPEMFKDKLIDAFKKNCPEGILKSFKSDEDIWEYIMEQGTWGSVDESKTEVGLKLAKKNPQYVIIGNGGSGTSVLAKAFMEGGIQGFDVIQPGDRLRDAIEATGEKIIMVDSLSQLPSIRSAMDELKPVSFPEMEYGGTPRNREERRAAKKGGSKR